MRDETKAILVFLLGLSLYGGFLIVGSLRGEASWMEFLAIGGYASGMFFASLILLRGG